MPAITIQIDQISDELKKQLVESITREVASITGYPAEYFFVYIQEYSAVNIGVGGKTLQEIRTITK
ncbi:MAG: 4-oxalocrotonate tautomerase DmpI [Fibrobacterota bacterium]|jgi:4-oxalocrotonate tautomerase family enzyme